MFVGSGKAITFHTFSLSRTWMLAAHFRLDCNSDTFVSSPGDLFHQESGDGVN